MSQVMCGCCGYLAEGDITTCPSCGEDVGTCCKEDGDIICVACSAAIDTKDDIVEFDWQEVQNEVTHYQLYDDEEDVDSL